MKAFTDPEMTDSLRPEPCDPHSDQKKERGLNRRSFLAGTAGVLGLLAVPSCSWEEFVQQHFKTDDRRGGCRGPIERLQGRLYKRKYGREFVVGTEAPIDGTLFGYALDIQRCIGCRRCVHACVEENNQSRDPEIQYIRVLRFKDGTMDLEESELYYDPEKVPEEGFYYMPVQCQHCANRALHQGLPGRSHLDGTGRNRRCGLQLVHRLPLLHGRVSLHGPEWFELSRNRPSRRTR